MTRAQEDDDAGEQRQQQRQQGSPLVQTAGEKATRESENTNVGEKNVPPACWHMQGRLTNAATGQTIALVEGVELSRNLAFETAQTEQEKRWKKDKETEVGARHVEADEGGGVMEEAGEELEVDKALRPGKWTAFGSLASKKFFMYKVSRSWIRLWSRCRDIRAIREGNDCSRSRPRYDRGDTPVSLPSSLANASMEACFVRCKSTKANDLQSNRLCTC